MCRAAGPNFSLLSLSVLASCTVFITAAEQNECLGAFALMVSCTA